MNCGVSPSSIKGQLFAPPSKSLAHRQLICAALSSEPSLIELPNIGDDVQSTIGCLKALGADIERSNGKLFVEPIGSANEAAVLNCCDSGSTLRFLLPVAAALSDSCTFTGSEALAARPVNELISAMEKNGVAFSEKTLPLTLSGRLSAGKYELTGNISSQYVSGLLLALPLLEGESEIEISGRLESKPYVDMTLEVLRDFGVKIEKTQKGFKICGKQQFFAETGIKTEGDWSSAAFFLTAAAICGKVSIKNLSESSAQGDKSIADFLRAFGAEVVIDSDGVTARKAELSACDIDISNTPDLFPALAVAACKARGESRFTGISRLRYKESDRVRSVIDMINALGGSAKLDGESVLINGSPLKGGVVDCRGDHRIAMAAAVAACCCSGKTKLMGAECVSKSYPAFWEDFAALGGKVTLNI